MDGLADVIDELIPDPPEKGQQVWMEGLALDLPLEVAVRTTPAGERLEASMPTQTFETSIMPVFHRLKLRIIADEDVDQGERQ